MRLNQERQKRLKPKRLQTAISTIAASGFQIRPSDCGDFVTFEFKGSTVKYYVYSGWASGKTIKDGRGLENLLKQIQS